MTLVRIPRLARRSQLARVMNNFSIAGLGESLPAPTFAINFLSGETLDTSITFTRGSVGTRTNSSGALESIGNNLARFDYDPITLAARGLLIEAARTNLFLNSAINGADLATQGVTVTAIPYVVSFYGTGTITFSGAYAGAPLVGSGTYPTRSSVTFTPSAGTVTCTVTGIVQYAQFEAGSWITSYIPTAGSTVARAFDSALITGTNFSNWFNAAEGTFAVESDQNMSGNTNQTIIMVDSNAATNRIYIGTSAGKREFGIDVAGSNVVGIQSTVSVLDNTPQKAAFGYLLNNSNAAFGGTIQTPDTVCAMPTGVDRLRFGISVSGSAASRLDGHIRSLTYYNTRLSNSLLQALSI